MFRVQWAPYVLAALIIHALSGVKRDCCSWKDTKKGVKRLVKEWEQTLLFISNRELISRIYIKNSYKGSKQETQEKNGQNSPSALSFGSTGRTGRQWTTGHLWRRAAGSQTPGERSALNLQPPGKHGRSHSPREQEAQEAIFAGQEEPPRGHSTHSSRLGVRGPARDSAGSQSPGTWRLAECECCGPLDSLWTFLSPVPPTSSRLPPVCPTWCY